MKKGLRKVNDWTFTCCTGLLSAGMMILLSMLGAKLLESGAIPMQALDILSLVILGLSSVFGAALTVIRCRGKMLLRCVLCATVFFLTVAILNGLLQKGRFCRIGVTAAVIYASAVLPGIIFAGKKKGYR